MHLAEALVGFEPTTLGNQRQNICQDTASPRLLDGTRTRLKGVVDLDTEFGEDGLASRHWSAPKRT
jgi:hypothetical protein